MDGYSYSTNEENFHGVYDSIESALEAAAEETSDDHCWIGEVEIPDFPELAGDWACTHLVSSVFEYFDELWGEWFESDLIFMEKKAYETLAPYISDALHRWCEDHGGITAWNVTNVKPYEITRGLENA